MAKKEYPDPFLRKTKKGLFYYFTYNDSKTGNRKNKATGFSKGKKEEARRFIRDFIDKLNSIFIRNTFREYALPYFIWETCPRVKRLLNEGKSIGRTHVLKSRAWLEQFVLTDKEFCEIPLTELKRKHIIDFRERLIKKIGICNTVNKVRDTIRTILSEAFLRQDIEQNPATKIGNVKYEKVERDVFSPAEIQSMFQECPGIWGDMLTYTVFYMAAHTGMRKNEILALS